MNFAYRVISKYSRKTMLKAQNGAAIGLAGPHVAQSWRVHLGFQPEHTQLSDAAKPPKGHFS